LLAKKTVQAEPTGQRTAVVRAFLLMENAKHFGESRQSVNTRRIPTEGPQFVEVNLSAVCPVVIAPHRNSTKASGQPNTSLGFAP
jgi:hypothetical protein